ncbi:hypothetical protein BDV96DRAFT_302643 [Lophiotrema nucula]|uniref:Uncharacterized protein n=1 Tax=Lophiotrema nucula TaxID=690887 RepID=A0A6A5YM05_9PLEO|nr:hypothetical protein BDV96DRAFT_302643 [Lophiotrema nucula]
MPQMISLYPSLKVRFISAFQCSMRAFIHRHPRHLAAFHSPYTLPEQREKSARAPRFFTSSSLPYILRIRSLFCVQYRNPQPPRNRPPQDRRYSIVFVATVRSLFFYQWKDSPPRNRPRWTGHLFEIEGIAAILHSQPLLPSHFGAPLRFIGDCP